MDIQLRKKKKEKIRKSKRKKYLLEIKRKVNSTNCLLNILDNRKKNLLKEQSGPRLPGSQKQPACFSLSQPL